MCSKGKAAESFLLMVGSEHVRRKSNQPILVSNAYEALSTSESMRGGLFAVCVLSRVRIAKM